MQLVVKVALGFAVMLNMLGAIASRIVLILRAFTLKHAIIWPIDDFSLDASEPSLNRLKFDPCQCWRTRSDQSCGLGCSAFSYWQRITCSISKVNLQQPSLLTIPIMHNSSADITNTLYSLLIVTLITDNFTIGQLKRYLCCSITR